MIDVTLYDLIDDLQCGNAPATLSRNYPHTEGLETNCPSSMNIAESVNSLGARYFI